MDRNNDLTISIEDWKEWRIIRFTGNFIVNTIPLVRKHIDEIEAGAAQKIALDLTEVSAIDSATMSIILNFGTRVRRKGGVAEIIGPGEKIMNSFYRIGLDSVTPVFPSRTLFEQGHSAV